MLEYSCRLPNHLFFLLTNLQISSWLAQVLELPLSERSWNSESMMVEVAKIGYSLGTNPLRLNFIIKNRLRTGLMKATFTGLLLLGLVTKKRKSTFNIDSKNTGQKYGNGSKGALTSTSVAIRPTWQRMYTVH